MRKRNKAARGSRSGRGNSRVGGKGGSNTSKSVSASSPATVEVTVTRNGLNGLNGISSCYIRTPNNRGRRGGNGTIFPVGSLISRSSSSSSSRLETDYVRSAVVGLSRNFDLANDNNSSKAVPVSSDYYLHKKFKKLTTTLATDDEWQNESGGAPGNSAGTSASGSDNVIPSGLNNHNSKNSLCTDNHLILSSDAPKTKENLKVLSNLNSSPDEANSSSNNSSKAKLNNPSTLSASSSELPPATMANSSNSAMNLSQVSNSTNTSTVVYKPKFRIAPDPVEALPISKTSLSSSSSISSSDELSLSVPDSTNSLPSSMEKSLPGRIGGELRMDRKSLDDHISKIIDENQSILSHWPEHLTKRLKSHVQKRQQQQQQQTMQLLQNSNSSSISQINSRNGSSNGGSDNNSIVIMSGGSTAVGESPLESAVPNNFSSHLGILKQTMNLSAPVLSTIQSAALIRSHSDAVLGGPTHLAEQSKKFLGENFSEWVSTGSNASSNSNGSNNSSSTVVPKKRRRLSPTPNRLCGGEVSELPLYDSMKPSIVSGRIQSGFQDVDMTVRMSNCGTSGAKVTIRTNSSSSNSSNSSSGTGSGAFGYNQLMDVPSSPFKLQSVASPSSSNSNHANIQPSSLLMRAGQGSTYFDINSPDPSQIVTLSTRATDAGPVDLKVGKSSGRPPKKGRPVEPLQIPRLDPSPKLSVIVSPSPSLIEPRMIKMPLESPLAPISLKKSPAAGITALSFPCVPTDSTSSADVSDMTGNIVKNEPITPVPSVSDKDTDNFLSISKTSDVSPMPLILQSTAPNPKRPTFLALKPMNAPPKASVPGALPSPETPRGAKSYNQMYINGHAYTSLVFKVSTRSSYTCLFKPQPMFLVQESDPKLSMYSNWQPRPRNKNQDETSVQSNDSKVNDEKSPRNFVFTTAGKSGTETVNSPDQNSTRWALTDPSFSSSSPSPTISSPTTSIKSTSDSTAGPLTSNSRPSELSISQSTLMIANAAGKNSRLPIVPSPSVVTTSLSTSTSFPAKSVTLTDPVIDYNSPNLSHHMGLLSGKTSMKDKFDVDSKIRPNVTSDSQWESPCSSADESSMSFSGRFSKVKSRKSRTLSSGVSAEQTIQGNITNSGYQDQDGPLSLTVKPVRNISRNSNSSNSHRDRDFHGGSVHSNDDDGEDDRHSVGIIDGRFENPRVRIMEGGFESNEDYTYVRGRGRGRYVCEACGIRCKKPSMLRKHLKTHTDLRPYTCKLCNFSFKTKGNLTKHQKSKSHHKKCMGLGIHPNSSQSLAMIGPAFSDTNTDDSEDEDDPGIYNGGDTDSQEDIDTEELSSSAEPDQINKESHSVENEIAQSLLDLSRINRISRETGGPGSGEKSVLMDSPLKSIQNQRLIQNSKVNGYSPRNLVIDENSCSQASIGSSTTEVPIDLSCRSKKISSSSTNDVDDDGDSNDFKRLRLDKKGIRSFGVVGEAQRWEPEEEFLITGCLNLKKIPNESNGNEIKSCPSLPSSNSLVPADVKPEIRSLNFCTNNNIGEKAYDLKLETKRKRESSTSSSCGGESYSAIPSSQSQSPATQLQPLPSTAILAPPMSHGLPAPKNSSGSQNCQNQSSKQQKLHQPWLSPRDSKSSSSPNPEGKNNVTEAPISPPLPLNGERLENNVLENLDKTRESIARPALTNDHSGQNNPGHVSGSNASSYSSLVGLKPQAEFRQPSGPQALVKGEGKAECNVCGKTFSRASQLNLHMNIHYLERPFRCDPCGVSFRTKGHLIKHRRSSSHEGKVKVSMTESWGVANEENPRPFKCPDCKIAFRIHGHLAKHLRSKMHIMRMECLGKLPFGIYFEMEKSGLNLTEIDTSDCDMSLISLQGVAKKIYGDTWTDRLTVPVEEPI